MSTKKSSTASEAPTEVIEEAAENESLLYETASENIPESKPAEENGFSIYLGPSIRGVIQHGTVYGMPKDQAVASLSDAVKAYPQIATLIVPGSTLPEDRIKVKTPGNVLSVSYGRLIALVNKKQGG